MRTRSKSTQGVESRLERLIALGNGINVLPYLTECMQGKALGAIGPHPWQPVRKAARTYAWPVTVPAEALCFRTSMAQLLDIQDLTHVPKPVKDSALVHLSQSIAYFRQHVHTFLILDGLDVLTDLLNMTHDEMMPWEAENQTFQLMFYVMATFPEATTFLRSDQTKDIVDKLYATILVRPMEYLSASEVVQVYLPCLDVLGAFHSTGARFAQPLQGSDMKVGILKRLVMMMMTKAMVESERETLCKWLARTIHRSDFEQVHTKDMLQLVVLLTRCIQYSSNLPNVVSDLLWSMADLADLFLFSTEVQDECVPIVLTHAFRVLEDPNARSSHRYQALNVVSELLAFTRETVQARIPDLPERIRPFTNDRVFDVRMVKLAFETLDDWREGEPLPRWSMEFIDFMHREDREEW